MLPVFVPLCSQLHAVWSCGWPPARSLQLGHGVDEEAEVDLLVAHCGDDEGADRLSCTMTPLGVCATRCTGWLPRPSFDACSDEELKTALKARVVRGVYHRVASPLGDDSDVAAAGEGKGERNSRERSEDDLRRVGRCSRVGACEDGWLSTFEQLHAVLV